MNRFSEPPDSLTGLMLPANLKFPIRKIETHNSMSGLRKTFWDAYLQVVRPNNPALRAALKEMGREEMLTLVFDEEGHARGYPINYMGMLLNGHQVIYGDVLLVQSGVWATASDHDEIGFAPLPDDFGTNTLLRLFVGIMRLQISDPDRQV